MVVRGWGGAERGWRLSRQVQEEWESVGDTSSGYRG
jgi:hypothetical protein